MNRSTQLSTAELLARIERLEHSRQQSRRRWRNAFGGALVLGALVPIAAQALGPVPYSFSAGEVISASQMNNNFAHLQNAITNLEDLLSDVTDDVEDLDHDLEHSTAVIANIEHDLENTTTDLDTLGHDLENLDTTVGGLTTTVSGLDSTVSGLGTTVHGFGSTVSGLDTTVSGLDSTVSGLDSTVSGLDSTVSGLDSTVSGLDAAVTDLEALPPEVPSGTIIFFDGSNCPSGWSEDADSRGRVLVGLSGSSGTLGGTNGSPLSDLENRSHRHSVDPGSTNTNSTGSHNHQWLSNGTHSWNSSGSSRFIANGAPWGAGFGDTTLYLRTVSSADYYTTNAGSHSHSVNIPNTNTSYNQAVVPYIQYLVCVRN